MKQELISREVCEQLAFQLVTEQATLVKQEAVVEGIIETLKEKKKEIIRKRLEGKLFKLDDSKVVAIAVDYYDLKNGMWVDVCFAKEPESFLKDKTNLTKKEQSLLSKYQKLFKRCRWEFNKEASKEIQNISRELHQLKHGLLLTDCRSWSFSIEEFSSNTFFRNSGLYVDNMSKYGGSILIENCI